MCMSPKGVRVQCVSSCQASRLTDLLRSAQWSCWGISSTQQSLASRVPQGHYNCDSVLKTS